MRPPKSGVLIRLNKHPAKLPLLSPDPSYLSLLIYFCVFSVLWGEGGYSCARALIDRWVCSPYQTRQNRSSNPLRVFRWTIAALDIYTPVWYTVTQWSHC